MGARPPAGVRASLDALAAPRDGRGGFPPFRNVARNSADWVRIRGTDKRPKIKGASSIFSAGRREMMLGPRQQLRVGVARAGTAQRRQADEPNHAPHDHPGDDARSRASDQTPVQHRGGASVRRRGVGDARRAHRPWRPHRVRADRRRVPQELVAERDEHRRPEVLPRADRQPRARAFGQADDLPRGGHDRRLGRRRAATSPPTRTHRPSRTS